MGAVVEARTAIMGVDGLQAIVQQGPKVNPREHRDHALELLRRAVGWIDWAEQALDPITKGSRETIGPLLDRGPAGETPNH